MTPAEHLAKLFHETYESLAPQYGYETQKETAVPWEVVPESNRLLMIATCNSLLANDKSLRGCIAELEAQIAAMRPVVDAAIAFVHQPGSAHYIPESLSPVCKLEEAVRTYEEVQRG